MSRLSFKDVMKRMLSESQIEEAPQKPKQIYEPGYEPDYDTQKKKPEGDEETNSDLDKLSPEEREKLYKQGSVLVPLEGDPERPYTLGSKVISLPKLEKSKKELAVAKKNLTMYSVHPDPEIRSAARETIKMYRDLGNKLEELRKLIEYSKTK